MTERPIRTRTLRNPTADPTEPLGAEPMLFCVLQGARPMDGWARHRLGNVDEVLLGRGDGYSYARTVAGDGKKTLHVTVMDGCMSSSHACLYRDDGEWFFQDLGSRNGSMVNGRGRKNRHSLSDGDVIELGQTFFVFRDSLTRRGTDAADLHSNATFGGSSGIERDLPVGLHTSIPELAHRFDHLQRFAASDVSIVVLGESGTGKDIMARAIHKLSQPERIGDFVPVNCGAIPDHLVESELFGHAAGAFTGASSSKVGLITAAHRGTLFLDEIGDMPLPAQVALLRVLQEREVRPVGQNKSIKVDFRVVAATHQPLESMVEERRFRDDLWSRLSEFKLQLPPLRERREDLGIFIAHLLHNLLGDRAGGVSFSNDAARAIFNYRWPRNVRELGKCLKTALVLARDEEILLEHLPREIRDPAPSEVHGHDEAAPARARDSDAERRERIIEALTRNNGNVSAVARELGKGRTQILRWISRYQIDLDRYRR